MRPVVGAVHDDGVVGYFQLIQQVEQFTDVLVMFDHDVVVFRLPAAGLTQDLGFGMGTEMHGDGVKPDKEGFVVLMLAFDKALGRSQELFIHRLHALLCQRAGIFDAAIGVTVQHAPGAEVFPEVGKVFFRGVIPQLRLFLGVQVIEVAEELVEPVVSGQEFILIAEVVLAKLTGGIAQGL